MRPDAAVVVALADEVRGCRRPGQPGPHRRADGTVISAIVPRGD